MSDMRAIGRSCTLIRLIVLTDVTELCSLVVVVVGL